MPRKPQFGRIYRRTKKRRDGTVITLPTLWIEYYRNGRKYRESTHSTKQGDAERLLKKRQAEIYIGTFGGVQAERVLVSELLDDLIADYEINGKSAEWARYVDAHLRPHFGNMRAATVGSTAIQKYIAARRAQGRANGTINRELALLRRAFNLGAQAVPPKVVRVPRIPTLEENNVRKGFFEYPEFAKLRGELPDYMKPVITFAYYTGCRRGEILGLRWSQVDLAERVIRLEPGETKNDQARILPLAGDLYEVVKMRREIRDANWPECPWVFCRNGKPIKNFASAWAEASKRAQLVDADRKPTRLFHDLRRTGVRNLIRAGVPERVAMLISGHKTRSVLDRYNIVDERDLHEAAWRLDRYVSEKKAEHQNGLESKNDRHTLGTPEPTPGTTQRSRVSKSLK
jgi:integrase